MLPVPFGRRFLFLVPVFFIIILSDRKHTRNPVSLLYSRISCVSIRERNYILLFFVHSSKASALTFIFLPTLISGKSSRCMILLAVGKLQLSACATSLVFSSFVFDSILSFLNCRISCQCPVCRWNCITLSADTLACYEFCLVFSPTFQ